MDHHKAQSNTRVSLFNRSKVVKCPPRRLENTKKATIQKRLKKCPSLQPRRARNRQKVRWPPPSWYRPFLDYNLLSERGACFDAELFGTNRGWSCLHEEGEQHGCRGWNHHWQGKVDQENKSPQVILHAVGLSLWCRYSPSKLLPYWVNIPSKMSCRYPICMFLINAIKPSKKRRKMPTLPSSKNTT